MLGISAACAVVRCASVCPSRLCIVSKRVIISLDLWQYPDWDPLIGVSNAGGGVKKSQFSANVLLYLGNDTTYGHSYYGTPIGTRMRSSKSRHFNDLE